MMKCVLRGGETALEPLKVHHLVQTTCRMASSLDSKPFGFGRHWEGGAGMGALCTSSQR